MKLIMRPVFSLLFILPLMLSAQQKEWCGSDQMLQDWLQTNPDVKYKVMETDGMMKHGQRNNSKAPLIIVPVVVHIIHSNGEGNISKAQIEDGIKNLNEEFSKTHADTGNIRTAFKSIAADVEIEFRLANKDPNGNCTEGITRTNSILTYEATNSVKSLAYWSKDKYLNFWVVNSIGSGTGGTTLGYAQFPFFNNTNYGAVVINRAWGSIGTANADRGVISHEVGHMFDLLHTFQSGCGNFCQNSGDRVCDTPPTSGQTFTCNNSLNTCSNDTRGGTAGNPNPFAANQLNMNENFMSYDDCRAMFTEGQKTRMRSALGFYSQLINLTRSSNLTATGTNNGFVKTDCAPIVDIHFLKEFACQGASVTLSDDSYNGPLTTYEWKFPGGTPTTSSLATPSVSYNNPGTYDVTLKISNTGGSDSLTISDAIVVGDTSAAAIGFNYSQGFESATSIGSDWVAVNPTGTTRWTRVPNTSYSGTASAFLNNFSGNIEGEVDYLVSPPIDLTQVVNPAFEFRVAYKQVDGASNDVLRAEVSLDCGKSWIVRAFLNPFQMSSGISTNFYVPSRGSADWKLFSLPTTQAMRNHNNVLFRFNFTSGTGNSIFIDDFKVTGNSVVGIEKVNVLESNFSIYPNPTNTGSASIQFSSDSKFENASLYVSNILGEKVQKVFAGELNETEYRFDINTSELSPGIYFVTLRSGARRITKKLIVN